MRSAPCQKQMVCHLSGGQNGSRRTTEAFCTDVVVLEIVVVDCRLIARRQRSSAWGGAETRARAGIRRVLVGALSKESPEIRAANIATNPESRNSSYLRKKINVTKKRRCKRKQQSKIGSKSSPRDSINALRSPRLNAIVNTQRMSLPLLNAGRSYII